MRGLRKGGLVLGAIAFLCGILIFHTLAELPDRRWGLLGLPILVLGAYLPRLRLLGLATLGFLWALASTGAGLPIQLPSNLESEDLWVEGWVASIPEPSFRHTRFELEVDNLRDGEAIIPFVGRLRLAWYNTPPSLRVGDKWGLTVRLKRPRGLANPGGYDYERWLFVNRIAARGYVREYPPPRLLEQATRYSIDHFRQQLTEHFLSLLPNNPYTGILIALAVGERQWISQRQWEIFTRTGTGHLIAISGLHIGLIAGMAFFLSRHVWSWYPLLMRYCPAAKAAALAALLSAAGYALLAGLSLPTQRALIMVGVVMLALLGQRHTMPGHSLALALVAVLILDPTAPLSGGFWLSFGAVAAILYTATGRIGGGWPLHRWLSLQLAITLALLPATLALFGHIPLFSPLANLIAIPWTSITVVPLTLLAVLAGLISDTAQIGLLRLASLTMDWLWQFLVWLGDLSWTLIHHPAPPAWTLVFALPGILLWLAPRGLPGRWLGMMLLLPLFFLTRAIPPEGIVWFTLLDVGDGMAAVIRTSEHVLVYDTGPRLGANFDAARAALIPFLRQQGVERIDMLIISHADSRHTGGVRSLLEQFQVDQVLTAAPREVPVSGAQVCRLGQEWDWDGVRFKVLHPPPLHRFSAGDASCVLRVEGQGGNVLLTGDIGIPAQIDLARTFGPSLSAEILVAPHHGTRDSVSTEFVTAVAPRYVLFSTGYGNRYGHPRPETLRRYGQTGASLLDTAQQGAISFRLQEPGKLVPENYRQQARRYWHTP